MSETSKPKRQYNRKPKPISSEIQQEVIQQQEQKPKPKQRSKKIKEDSDEELEIEKLKDVLSKNKDLCKEIQVIIKQHQN